MDENLMPVGLATLTLSSYCLVTFLLFTTIVDLPSPIAFKAVLFGAISITFVLLEEIISILSKFEYTPLGL